MPIRVNVDSQANLVTLTGSGQLTYHDFEAAFEERLRHPHCKPNMDILYDLRAATIDITLQELKQSALFLRIINRSGEATSALSLLLPQQAPMVWSAYTKPTPKIYRKKFGYLIT